MKRLNIQQKDIITIVLGSVVFIELGVLIIGKHGVTIYIQSLTPTIALLTGIAIFLSFRESQKSNRFLLSKELYDDYKPDLLEKIGATEINVEMTNTTARSGVGGSFVIQLYKNLEGIDVINWHEYMMNLLDSVKSESGFSKRISDYDKGNITNANFNNFPYADLPKNLDAILLKVVSYYRILQHQYNFLLTNGKKSLAPTHLSILKSFIEHESNYENFIFEIERYFNINEKSDVELTTAANHYNIVVLEQDSAKKQGRSFEPVIKKRNLIDWGAFSQLYKIHKEIEALSGS